MRVINKGKTLTTTKIEFMPPSRVYAIFPPREMVVVPIWNIKILATLWYRYTQGFDRCFSKITEVENYFLNEFYFHNLVTPHPYKWSPNPYVWDV